MCAEKEEEEHVCGCSLDVDEETGLDCVGPVVTLEYNFLIYFSSKFRGLFSTPYYFQS